MDVAYIFNCAIRNSGTATYAGRALKILEEQGEIKAKHFWPRDKVPKGYDFYVYFDDGRDDIDWLPPHPCAYWAVDTHLGYGYRLWKAQQFDRVFVAQKPAVEAFKRDGVKNVQWLPLACHPEAHLTKQELIDKGVEQAGYDMSEEWDIAFVGYLMDCKGEGYNNRIDYLDILFKKFPNSRLGISRFFEEMSMRFAKARIGFNVSIKRDLNMRVFEVMSCGTALLTNRDVDGIDELFTEGEDYLGYKGTDEMVAAASAALADSANRKGVAESALAKVRSRHTYVDRMKTIIEEMKHV